MASCNGAPFVSEGTTSRASGILARSKKSGASRPQRGGSGAAELEDEE